MPRYESNRNSAKRLVRKVYEKGKQCFHIDELVRAIKQAWAEITKFEVLNLIDGMLDHRSKRGHDPQEQVGCLTSVVSMSRVCFLSRLLSSLLRSGSTSPDGNRYYWHDIRKPLLSKVQRPRVGMCHGVGNIPGFRSLRLVIVPPNENSQKYLGILWDESPLSGETPE